jgi:predicted DNA-binding transcriptional regulator YafY
LPDILYGVRADRLLSILLLLQGRGRLTARDLAGRLEVSQRTILRDMEALSAAGVPVFAERGSEGGWSLAGDYQTKLTGLSTGEIQSLFLGRAPAVMADLGLKEQWQAALIKLQASLPAGSRQQADLARERILIDHSGWRDRGESLACLPTLLDALWRGRRLRFVYTRVFCEPSEKTIEPLGLVAKGSTWYLVGRADGEPRTYRVSRISGACVLPETARPRNGFDLAEYWTLLATEFREKLPRYYASFAVNSSILRWVRYRGWRLEQETPDGDRVHIRIRFDAEEEATQFALSFGGDLEVLEPPELRSKVLAGALAAARVYES